MKNGIGGAVCRILAIFVALLAMNFMSCGGGGGTTSTIVDLSSIEGSSDVPVGSSFKYTFTKAVISATVSTARFYMVETPSADLVATPSSNNSLLPKGAYNTTACSETPLDGSVTCASTDLNCTLKPTADLSAATSYTACLTNGITYADGEAFAGASFQFTTAGGVTLTAPTAAAIRTAIGTNNTYGMAVGLTLGEITLPECTSTLSTTITYSIPDLPSWLSFDTSTRALTLASGTTVPSDALTAAVVTYACTQGSSSATVELTINDLDGGGVVDGHEYLNGAVPLANGSFGWIELNPGNVSEYRTSTVAAVPTGLIKPTVGMDPTDPDDDTADFDGDTGVTGGGTNAEEIAAGTNLMVYVTDGTFADDDKYTTGTDPVGLTSADFDGDGDMDLAVPNNANGAGNTLSVLLGNGDGTFASKVDYTTGTGPWYTTSADYNGDGDIDLAVTNCGNGEGNTLSVLLGNGNGTFASKVDYTTGTGPYIINSADYNGDGDIDLAVSNGGNADGTTVSVLLGNGDGTFASKVDYTVGTGPESIISADFDGDGDIDLAVVNFANGEGNTLSVLLGNGDGTFASKVDYNVGVGPMGLTSADFNGDGYIDLALTNSGTEEISGTTISVLLGNGDGTFADREIYTTGNSPNYIIAADFDGDGYIDLANSNYGDEGTRQGLSILLGAGDGTFADVVIYAAGDIPQGVAAADFDGDGDIDAAISNSDDGDGTTISVFLNQ